MYRIKYDAVRSAGIKGFDCCFRCYYEARANVLIFLKTMTKLREILQPRVLRLDIARMMIAFIFSDRLHRNDSANFFSIDKNLLYLYICLRNSFKVSPPTKVFFKRYIAAYYIFWINYEDSS